MHLLVLSAFRLSGRYCSSRSIASLNAPFGAQCFPTRWAASAPRRRRWSQCTFWCSVLSDSHSFGDARFDGGVSMHLLVLSAFRPEGTSAGSELPFESQCTFWCSVLSDIRTFQVHFNRKVVSMHLLVLSAFRPETRVPYELEDVESQCTFWCSVLSDS